MNYRKTKPSAKTASLLFGRAEASPLQGTGRLRKAAHTGVVDGTWTVQAGQFTPLTVFVPKPLPGHDYSDDNSSSDASIIHVVGPGAWPTSYPVVVCPVRLQLQLWTETTSKVSLATGKKRTVAHSKKRTLTEANLLAATLARHNITDPTGWSLVACARKASFASFADFDLMAHHVDGTLLPLSTATHLNTVPLGKSEYSPNLTAWTERAVRSTRNTTAAGASTETRKTLVYGQYTQVLPIDDIELSLSGIYRTEERHTEKDILADPPALVITHKGTTATLIGTHEKGPVGGIAQLVLEIGKPLPGKHVYHEPALFSYDLTIEGRGSIQAP